MKKGVTKKVTKRGMALMLATSMALAMAGCGKTTESKDVSNASGNVEQSTESKTTETNDAPKEFEYFGQLWEPYQESTPVYDALQEATGVKVNFTWNSSDSYSTLLAARIANQDLPDVIGYGVDSSLLQGLIDDGLIIPLTDYLDEYMPNYMRFITDEDYLYMLNQSDGEVYAFGMLMDVPGAYSTMIRQDWLDNLGLKMPTTWDEWVATWEAFAKEDANGNGDPNDEIPFAFAYSFTYWMENYFGIASNGSYSIVDGDYVYDPEHPRYEEFLDAMRDLYSKGLISKEFPTLTYTEMESLAASDVLGSCVGYAVLAEDGAKNAMEINKDAYYVCTEPITGPHGDQMIERRIKLTLNTYITKNAVDEGKLETILGFFDFIFSDEGIKITNYGIEGESYEMVNGEPTLLSPMGDDFTSARKWGIIPTPIAFCFTQDVYSKILYAGKTYEEMDKHGQTAADGLGKLNTPYYYTRPVRITTEASMEYTDLIEQQKTLRDKYIMGEISKDQYKSEYEGLKEAGLNEVIEQANETYHSIVEAAK